MDDLPTVVSETELSNSFITGTIQVCVVVRDHRQTLEGFVRAGIGPWRIYQYSDAPMIAETKCCGADATFSMTLCLAWTGTMLWEVIEPMGGPTIYQDFLDSHGEGVQHVALACGDMPYEDQIKEFERRGFPVIQSGVLQRGRVPFHYFDTEDAMATTFEIYNLPPGPRLEPDAWFPAPPPGR